MLFVEQTVFIEAPMEIVMQALNDVENIPEWATIKGVIDNVQGGGPGMTYDWYYSIEGLKFSGKSEVIEQTANSLITETTGDVASIWTVNLSPAGKHSTAMQVVVEYMPKNRFVELLTDIVIQRYATPVVALDNMNNFKEMVEERARIAEEAIPLS